MIAYISVPDKERSSEHGILRYDLSDGSARWIPVGSSPSTITGTVGLFVHNDRLYAIYLKGHNQASALSVYQGVNDPAMIADLDLSGVYDGHSLWVDDGRMILVSTGTDEVLTYAMKDGIPDGAPKVLWSASNVRRDTHHVNSLTVRDGHVCITALGPRSGEKWSSATRGYVYDITAAKFLKLNTPHPHSLTNVDGTLYYLESSIQNLCNVRGQVAKCSGYPRGLAYIGDNRFLIGTNVIRRISKSTKTPVANENNLDGTCGLTLLSLGGTPPKDYDLGAYMDEIYDVTVVYD